MARTGPSLKLGDSDTRALFLVGIQPKSDTLAPAYHITWPEGALNAGQQSILTFSLAELDEKANPPGAEDAEVDKGESSGEGAGEGAENEKDSIVVSDSLTLAETDKPFIDFTIRLTDRDGSVLEFPLSDFAPLQHPLKRKMTKLGFMQPQAKWETVLQTYSFPLQRDAGDHPEFDFGHITGMSFLFNLTPEGVIVWSMK